MTGTSLSDIKYLILGSIISADNEECTEDQKQEVIHRYELEKDQERPDWEFILEPIGADNRLLKLFI